MYVDTADPLAIILVVSLTGLVIATVLPVGLISYHRAASDRNVAWLAGGAIPGPHEAGVYRSYLTRHARSRLIGCLAALVVCLVAAVRWQVASAPTQYAVSVGVGPAPLAGNLLAWGLGGTVLGNLFAESYRLPRRGAVRHALLESRASRPLKAVTATAWAAGAVAVVGAASVWVLLGDTGGLPGAAFGLLVIALAEATHRAIINRPRPVSGIAVRVDSRLRRQSDAGLAWLQLAGAGLGIAMTLGNLAFSTWPPMTQVTLWIVTWTALIVAIIGIFRSGIRPPRRWPVPIPQAVDLA